MGRSGNVGVAMLASVTDAEEARTCVAVGVDVVDCKDPGAGALGALDDNEIRNIVGAVGGRVCVSATVGDLPCKAGVVLDRVLSTAQTGVDFVKVGLFGDNNGGAPAGEGIEAVVKALGRLELGPARLVAVLLADQGLDLRIINDLATAGFAGVMLDTADKSAGSLCDVLTAQEIGEFVSRAQAGGLFAGLAGRLRLAHVPRVLEYAPDIIGFRGALCVDGVRGSRLDSASLCSVRSAIPVSGDRVARGLGLLGIDGQALRAHHNAAAN